MIIARRCQRMAFAHNGSAGGLEVGRVDIFVCRIEMLIGRVHKTPRGSVCSGLPHLYMR